MDELSKKRCVPCSGSTPPLKGESLAPYLSTLSEGWAVASEHHIEKEYRFKNFKEALAFVNQVGALAEAEGHHPDIYLTWGKVRLCFWTHKIDGLSENDFIMAAKADARRSD